jgi:hypothetical protein
MYKRLFFAFALTLLTACKKDPATNTDPIVLAAGDVVLSTGSFVNNGHSTSGKVQLIKDKDGNKFLILENFDSDSGPDLRLYLSASKKDDDYTEISQDITLGNVKLAVPASANTDTQKFLLVWCEQYSVLFGHAELF